VRVLACKPDGIGATRAKKSRTNLHKGYPSGAEAHRILRCLPYGLKTVPFISR
jgi:hypothetical protein